MTTSNLARIAGELRHDLEQRRRRAELLIWRLTFAEATGIRSQFTTDEVQEALTVLGRTLDDVQRDVGLLAVAITGRTAQKVELARVAEERRAIVAEQQAAEARVAEAQQALEVAQGDLRRLDSRWAAVANVEDRARAKVTQGERAADDLRARGWYGWHQHDRWCEDVAAATAAASGGVQS